MSFPEVAIAGLIAFTLTVLLTPLFKWIAVRMKAIREPGGRHQHVRPVPLFGGAAVIIAILLTWILHPTLVFTSDLVALFVGLLLLLIMGVLDDVLELAWPILLLGHLAAGIFLLAGAISLTSVNIAGVIRLDQVLFSLPDAYCFADTCVLPLLGSVLLLAWIVVVVNALNWLDGADGVASSVAAVALLALMFLALRPHVGQPPLMILAAAGFGAALAFLIFNAPPAKVFLGSAGSFGLGYLIAALAVLSGAKLATTATVLLIPLADMAAVLIKRFYAGVSLTQGDRRHLHHTLKKRGVSPRKLLLLYVAAVAVFGAAAVLLPQPIKSIVLLVGFLALTLTLVLLDNGIERKFK